MGVYPVNLINNWMQSIIQSADFLFDFLIFESELEIYNFYTNKKAPMDLKYKLKARFTCSQFYQEENTVYTCQFIAWVSILYHLL